VAAALKRLPRDGKHRTLADLYLVEGLK